MSALEKLRVTFVRMLLLLFEFSKKRMICKLDK